MADEVDGQPTVWSRGIAAGITEDALRAHFERGTLMLDGERVTDLDQPAPRGTRIVASGQ